MKDWFKLTMNYLSGPTINKYSWPVILRNMVNSIFVIMPSVIYSKRDGIYMYMYVYNFYWSLVALQCCLSFCYTANESALHIHISPLCHHGALSRVPCAI